MQITILSYLKENLHLFKKPIIGCTKEELAAISSMFNGVVPAAFLEFMFLGGHNFTAMVRTISYGYFSLLDYQLWQEDLIHYLTYDGIYQGSEIVVTGQEGTTYIYIQNNEGDDPPVYKLDDFKKFIKIYNSFSEYINILVDRYKSDHGL